MQFQRRRPASSGKDAREREREKHAPAWRRGCRLGRRRATVPLSTSLSARWDISIGGVSVNGRVGGGFSVDFDFGRRMIEIRFWGKMLLCYRWHTDGWVVGISIGKMTDENASEGRRYLEVITIEKIPISNLIDKMLHWWSFPLVPSY